MLMRILFFIILVGGLIFIFREEFQRILYNEPSANTPEDTESAQIVKKVEFETNPQEGSSQTVRPTKINFGSGSVLSSSFKNPSEITKPEALHTIVGRISKHEGHFRIKAAAEAFPTSPFAGNIFFLDRTTEIKSKEAAKEYLVLLTADSLSSPINITGWTLVDNLTKKAYEIPQGFRVFGNFDAQRKENIYLESNQTIIVSSGRSPVGHSFFVNKCTGYRTQFKTFSPNIKTQCPEPVDELVANNSVPYSDFKCYEFVEDVEKCTTITSLPGGVTNACISFLQNTLTESGCIELHRNDPDFFLQEWRVFLNQDNRGIWKDTTNTIYLLDNQKRLVASLIYE